MFARRFARGMGFVVAVVAVCSFSGWSARGQEEQPHPIVAQVRATLKDPGKPFTLAVHLHLKEGMGERFEAAFVKSAKTSRQEKGCQAYDLSRDAKSPTTYLAYERWQDVSALEAHVKAPHFTALVAEIGEMLAGPPKVDVLVPVGN